MATTTTTSPAPLPDYIQSAKPNPPTNRAAWYLSTGPTYAGIFLWFAFWDQMPSNGLQLGGLGPALLGVFLGAVICHFLFYVVPATLGMKTGLPLYIVGTSTFGAMGGLLMPGFLMGVLQFGWLAVNAFMSSMAIVGDKPDNLGPIFYIVCILWVVAAAFVGLKGIQYVAKVATFLPLIPLAVLLYAVALYGGSAGDYQPPAPSGDGHGNLALLAVLAMAGQIVGFFATAGAAGVDFGMGNRDEKDVHLGGLVGILFATLLTAGLSVLIVAGAHVQGVLRGDDMTATNSLAGLSIHRLIMVGLAIAAFPGACFSSFIAANSFKTVMPKVNPFFSVGIGAVVSILLAVSGLAGKLPAVFIVIGASFGPICGAMCVDYLLAGMKWAGPRAGFNPAGWGAWLLGFIVGILPNLGVPLPAAPIAAFIVGAVVYFAMAKAGLESPVIPYAPAAEQKTA